MKNNGKIGFMKYEVLTVILLILGISCCLLGVIFTGVSVRKLRLMKDDAINFSKIVITNNSSFHNLDTVYLQEVIEEKLLRSIKSPFSFKPCSVSESKVVMKDGSAHVTLKCDNYLIDNVSLINADNADIYRVSKWRERKKNDTDQKKVMYNCKKNGKELYKEYYEELYFVSRINSDYDTDYYFANDVDVCKVVKKTYYRTKVKS